MALQPGPQYPGATVLSTTDVTADRLSFVAAATGLTLLGFKASLQSAGGGARGQLFHGAATGVINTTVIATWDLVTATENGQHNVWFGLPGIKCENGISIDHIAGSFDVTVYYKTVT